MKLEEIDAAIEAVKDRWDHAAAPYDADVLGVIRAAEAMRSTLGAVQALTRSTDGDALDPDEELPVGVFQQALGDLG